MPSDKDGLRRYYDKRSADQTPEPFGGAALSRVFVVQKHSARRLHYDLRLEMDGVLKSWAVPRGPSFDPAIKRLAVRTEDHPINYIDFEGVIPKGNYGAGAMIVWDRGTWVPLENPDAGMKKGKLLFELKGMKLRGVFTLVKTKGDDDEWLLIKKPDAYSGPDAERAPPQESILSGLTVEELLAGHDRVAALSARVEALGPPRGAVSLADLKPMLAESREAPFSDPAWLYEIKYDGYRLLAEKRGGQVSLRYRSGRDATRVFPDVVKALVALPFDDVLLDGEVTVLADDGRPHFQSLQKRVQLARERDLRVAAAQLPATFYVFDLLAYGPWDLRGLTLLQRKGVLRDLLPQTGVVRYGDHVEGIGEAFYEQVRALGLEGMMAKRAASPYVEGRSAEWLKLRIERTDDFAIVGFTVSDKPGRLGFRGLHLARGAGRDLVYAGRAGSGFTQEELRSISARLEPLITDAPGFLGEVPRVGPQEDVWVRPELVCEVRYLHKTEDGHLRHPVFLRMRDDKSVEDLLEPEPEHFESSAATPPEQPEPSREVPFTNLDKPFWPEDGYTKRDLIEFYREISPFLLPYLHDRPLVLTRYPDGIDGKNFFQKDAPPFIPGWVRTERMWSESAHREIDYFVADDLETLLYVVNLGSIPLHVWSSRICRLQHPDWCILDLDPKGAPFADVVTLARAIHGLCEEIGLPSYPKTSGSTGLHVLIPLGGQCTYEQSRTLAELMARVIASEHPDIATIERYIPSREGRVYLDFGQNGHGRLLVSALCVRPLPGAPVSTPLAWSEVDERLDPKAFTIRTVPPRLAERGDLLQGVLTDRPDLGAALDRLAHRIHRA